MSVLIIFIQKAIVQGICILYGALGEIMTEKSGNLNLGIPGIMYMGGISGLMGAFLYEKDNPNPNALVGVLISFLCAFACAAIGGLIYSILTITLRVNQNVTGLALTMVQALVTSWRFHFQTGRRCRTDFRKSNRKCLYGKDPGIIKDPDHWRDIF